MQLPDIKPELNPEAPEIYKYQIGKIYQSHGPKTEKWFVCGSTPDGEILYLCPNTNNPFEGGLFYWHPDQGRVSYFDSKPKAVFSLWRTVMREQSWSKYAAA